MTRAAMHILIGFALGVLVYDTALDRKIEQPRQVRYCAPADGVIKEKATGRVLFETFEAKLPAAWLNCAPSGTRSTPSLPPSSSGQSHD